MEPTAEQRAALELICDTFLPGDGLALPPASDLGAVDTIFRILGRNPREAERKQLATLLGLWDSRLFGLLTGRGPRHFSSLSQQQREDALIRLGDSRLAPVRAVFQALKGAALLAYNVTPGPTGVNPLWKEIGYPAPAGPLAQAPEPALKPLRYTESTTLTCDVVIVGSGAGGGTAAAVLAEAGLDVIVLERGNYYDDRDFGTGELEGLLNLYAPVRPPPPRARSPWCRAPAWAAAPWSTGAPRCPPPTASARSGPSWAHRSSPPTNSVTRYRWC